MPHDGSRATEPFLIPREKTWDQFDRERGLETNAAALGAVTPEHSA